MRVLHDEEEEIYGDTAYGCASSEAGSQSTRRDVEGEPEGFPGQAAERGGSDIPSGDKSHTGPCAPPFGRVKRGGGYCMMRHGGLAKPAAPLYPCFALAPVYRSAYVLRVLMGSVALGRTCGCSHEVFAVLRHDIFVLRQGSLSFSDFGCKCWLRIASNGALVQTLLKSVRKPGMLRHHGQIRTGTPLPGPQAIDRIRPHIHHVAILRSYR